MIIPLVKSELYGQIDLLANFGGILGLFLGISVISIFEIIFHCAFHPFIKYIQKRIIGKAELIILDIDRPFYMEKGNIIYLKSKICAKDK